MNKHKIQQQQQRQQQQQQQQQQQLQQRIQWQLQLHCKILVRNWHKKLIGKVTATRIKVNTW